MDVINGQRRGIYQTWIIVDCPSEQIQLRFGINANFREGVNDSDASSGLSSKAEPPPTRVGKLKEGEASAISLRSDATA